MKKPINLQGLRILNTRPLAQALALNEKIIAAQGYPLTCPVLEIVPVAPDWLHQLPPLKTLHHLIFTSRYAVEAVSMLIAPTDFSDTITVTAIGQSTASALKAWGMKVDFLPSESDSEHILQLPPFIAPHGQHIALFKGEGGRTLIPQTIVARGACLHVSSVYRRVISPDLNKNWTEIWRDGQVDIILLTSEETMQALLSKGMLSRCQSVPCLVFSERLADRARYHGIKTVFVCRTQDIIQAFYDIRIMR